LVVKGLKVSLAEETEAGGEGFIEVLGFAGFRGVE
jgi:hypothetical protein